MKKKEKELQAKEAELKKRERVRCSFYVNKCKSSHDLVNTLMLDNIRNFPCCSSLCFTLAMNKSILTYMTFCHLTEEFTYIDSLCYTSIFLHLSYTMIPNDFICMLGT